MLCTKREILTLEMPLDLEELFTFRVGGVEAFVQAEVLILKVEEFVAVHIREYWRKLSITEEVEECGGTLPKLFWLRLGGVIRKREHIQISNRTLCAMQTIRNFIEREI